MYFENRNEAGKLLAKELLDGYKNEKCVVIALSDGAVLVGEPIAESLNCLITMLLMEDIEVPGEGVNFGGVSQDGDFTYNSELSSGEIEDYGSEYHGYLDDQKQQVFQKLNRLLISGDVIDNKMLRDKVIILVSDGLNSGSKIDVAINFLKPVKIKRLIVVSPFSTVDVVDKLHLLADEYHVLDTKANYMGTNHYYNTNDIPSHEKTIAKVNDILKKWQK